MLSRSFDGGWLAPVTTFARGAGAQINLVEIAARESQLRNVPTSGHLTEATYYRLLLPELLPRSVRRVIYLDCDLVVRRDVAELWQCDLGQHSTAAVLEPRAHHHRDVGLRSETDYFNAGVLLLDLSAWREQHIHRRALEFATKFPGHLRYHDQDALNHVLDGRWQRLDSRWNQQFKFFVHTSRRLKLDRALVRRVRHDPFIIHFTTASKPWHSSNDHPWRRDYYVYLDATAFRGWRPGAMPLPERVHRWALGLVPHRFRPAILRNVYRGQFQWMKRPLERLAEPLMRLLGFERNTRVVARSSVAITGG